MVDSFDLKLLKQVSIADSFKDELADLRDVKIDSKKPTAKKMNDFLKQVKNPYLFKVGDVRVKVSFSGKERFTDVLGRVVSTGLNYQADLG